MGVKQVHVKNKLHQQRVNESRTCSPYNMFATQAEASSVYLEIFTQMISPDLTPGACSHTS